MGSDLAGAIESSHARFCLRAVWAAECGWEMDGELEAGDLEGLGGLGGWEGWVSGIRDG